MRMMDFLYTIPWWGRLIFLGLWIFFWCFIKQFNFIFRKFVNWVIVPITLWMSFMLGYAGL